MKTLKAFTTCNGEVVRLSHTGYVPEEHFSTAARLDEAIPERNVRYAHFSGPSGRKWSYLVGSCPSCPMVHFAERLIERPALASNHKCGGRCRSAKGNVCECSCGGAQHGAGN